VHAREHVVDLAVTIGEREDLRHTQEDQSEDEDQDQKQELELEQNQDEQLGRMVRSERDIRSVLESFAPPLRLRFDPEKPDRVVVLLAEDGAH
jgi:spore cortex formation protein SpoVR/YcgB (stage V sporulation)